MRLISKRLPVPSPLDSAFAQQLISSLLEGISHLFHQAGLVAHLVTIQRHEIQCKSAQMTTLHRLRLALRYILALLIDGATSIHDDEVHLSQLQRSKCHPLQVCVHIEVADTSCTE